MKTMLFVLLSALALVACGNQDASKIHVAEQSIASDLHDPASAQFRNLIVHHNKVGIDGTQTWAVCGEVNGKNGFGGYAGFSRFFYISGSQPYRDTDVGSGYDTEIFNIAYDYVCNGQQP